MVEYCSRNGSCHQLFALRGCAKMRLNAFEEACGLDMVGVVAQGVPRQKERLMKHVLLTMGTVALMACQPVTEDKVDADDMCNAQAAQGVVGQNVAAISFEKGADVRLIGPDTMVTMDYVPERLNLLYDAKGRVTEAYCG